MPSLPQTHSFSNTCRFLFSHLMILLRHDVVFTRHARENPPQSLHVVVVSLFFSHFFLFVSVFVCCVKREKNHREIKKALRLLFSLAFCFVRNFSRQSFLLLRASHAHTPTYTERGERERLERERGGEKKSSQKKKKNIRCSFISRATF